MADIGGIRIDEGLADILSKLRQSNSKNKEETERSAADQAVNANIPDNDAKSLVDSFSSQVKINPSNLIQ